MMVLCHPKIWCSVVNSPLRTTVWLGAQTGDFSALLSQPTQWPPPKVYKSYVVGWTWKTDSDISPVPTWILQRSKSVKFGLNFAYQWRLFRNTATYVKYNKTSGARMIGLYPGKIWCSSGHSPLRIIDGREPKSEF